MSNDIVNIKKKELDAQNIFLFLKSCATNCVDSQDDEFIVSISECEEPTTDEPGLIQLDLTTPCVLNRKAKRNIVGMFNVSDVVSVASKANDDNHLFISFGVGR